MQASVHSVDDETGAGSVLLDDGREVRFTAEVFERSALLRLRPGQRVSVEVADLDADTLPGATGRPEGTTAADAAPVPTPVPVPVPVPTVTRLWIVGIGPGETIR